MKFILANKDKLQLIMRIVKDAQVYLASQKIDQWQDDYPDEKIILQDITNKESYLVKNETSEFIGIAMFTTQAEPTYAKIDGSWLTSENASYGVIHRMAVRNDFRNKGIAKFIFNTCEQKLRESSTPSMRIDTHKDNREMQGLLLHLGYKYCGIIHLDEFETRMAYEKLIL